MRPDQLDAFVSLGQPAVSPDGDQVLVTVARANLDDDRYDRDRDARYDRDNPRTAAREIPSGRLSMRAAVVFVVVSAGLFLLEVRERLIGLVPFLNAEIVGEVSYWPSPDSVDTGLCRVT